MYFDPKVKERKEDFFNFEKELELFTRELKREETRLIVIKGIRRTGKSSLLRVGLTESAVPHAIIDLRAWGYFNIDSFHKQLTQSLSKLITERKELTKYLKRIKEVSIAGIKIEITPTNRETLLSILRELDTYGKNQGEHIILAFDEAQYLLYYPRFDALLAHTYDYLDHIKIVLAGSEIGLLDKLLGSKRPDAPLYGRPYTVIEMPRLSHEKSLEFLHKGFHQYGITINEHELQETIKTLDGIIGWLTAYGYHAIRLGHKKALEKTIKEGITTAKTEIEHFLATRPQARQRYLTILKILTEPHTWSEIKRGLTTEIGKPISDKQLTHYLKELLNYGLAQKTENKYTLADPLIRLATLKT